MADTLDDLERAVEELIVDARHSDTYVDVHNDRAAQARELVRRLRAGIAECERTIENEPTGSAQWMAARRILAKLTGATGEERRRGTT